MNWIGIAGGLCQVRHHRLSSSFFAPVTRSASPWIDAFTFSFRSLIAFWIVLAVSLSMPLLSLTFWRTVLCVACSSFCGSRHLGVDAALDHLARRAPCGPTRVAARRRR